MRFERLALPEARGHVLGHNIYDESGRRRLRKGRSLSEEDLALLGELGRDSIYVARLEDGDVGENDAALRIARSATGEGLRLSRAQTGRVNSYAAVRGVLRVDLERLSALNMLEGVALATLPAGSPVPVGKMVATLKIIPYALGGDVVGEGERIASGLVSLTELVPRTAGLILSGSPSARERIESSFRAGLEPRLHAWGARLEAVDFVSLDETDSEERLADAISRLLERGLDLLLLAGETAIMDRDDIAPRAAERAGAVVECYGAPVDPGNLLLLAHHGRVPIVGAPGCSRSPKTNIVDLVLPRLLAGDRLSRADIAAFGHGGLLEDVPERPQPRSWLT